jgi:hypothetical protein
MSTNGTALDGVEEQRERLTAERLVEIEMRLAAATPRPWRLGFANGGDVWQATLKGHEDERTHIAYTGLDTDPRHAADAEFIAHAPDDVAVLLAEVRRLEEVNGRLWQRNFQATTEAGWLRDRAAEHRIALPDPPAAPPEPDPLLS